MRPGNLKIYILFFSIIFFSNEIFSAPIEGNKVSLKILDKITNKIVLKNNSVKFKSDKCFGKIIVQ